MASKQRMRVIAEVGNDGRIISKEFDNWLLETGYIVPVALSADYIPPKRTMGAGTEIFGWIEVYPEPDLGADGIPAEDFYQHAGKDMKLFGMKPGTRVALEETREGSVAVYPLGRKAFGLLNTRLYVSAQGKRLREIMTNYEPLPL